MPTTPHPCISPGMLQYCSAGASPLLLTSHQPQPRAKLPATEALFKKKNKKPFTLNVCYKERRASRGRWGPLRLGR